MRVFLASMNVAVVKNGLTSCGALLIAIGGVCNAVGYGEMGLELMALGGAIAAFFAKDGNKSSTQLGIK